VATEAGSLMMVTTEQVQEGNADCLEADIPEASRGNPDSPHSADVINIESSSTFLSLSNTSSSSSTSSDYDDFPLGKI
jgi:hypothetical protein